MRKELSVAVALVLAAGTAFGAGSIISSFPSPHSNWPKGMAYHAGYLYHGSNYSYNRIYQTTTTGSVVRTITCPTNTVGVEFTGTYFWTCTYSPTYIYQLTSTGSVVKSFYSPVATGITFDGTYLWGSTWNNNTVYKLTTAGSVLSSFQGPASAVSGLDWANGYIWLANRRAPTGVYRITTTGSVVESYAPAPGASEPMGCAWDGNYLWYCNYNPRYVYQIDTAITSIVPSSLGKIKSIYR